MFHAQSYNHQCALPDRLLNFGMPGLNDQARPSALDDVVFPPIETKIPEI
jgi:hypothetical protein